MTRQVAIHTSRVAMPLAYASIFPLALGTFAIGTEGFMIAPLLPTVAADLGVSVPTAGHLVTAFAFAFALSSPVLTVLTGSVDRRRLLISSMIAFALANVMACVSEGYWGVMSARLLLALAAGLYVPNANALAGALVSPDKRGRALAIVNGGTTMAIAFGLPLAALIGHRFGWRMTFAAVAIFSFAATAGLFLGLSRDVGHKLPIASLQERAAVARRPSVLLALLVTTIWAMGAYVVLTYIAPYLTATTGLEASGIGAIVFLWGIAAAIGVFSGGYLSDRFGSLTVMIPALLLLALAFATLSASAYFLDQSHAIVPVVGAIVIWGFAAWGFFPAQQARLIAIGGLQVAPIVLSLNASFMFIGFSAGAALGSAVLASSSVANLGWVGASAEVMAVLLILATTLKAAPRPTST